MINQQLSLKPIKTTRPVTVGNCEYRILTNLLTNEEFPQKFIRKWTNITWQELPMQAQIKLL